MRFAPLLLLIAILSGAEREEFTLRDGRKLVGTYDEATGLLAITGGALKVKPDDIVSRDKAPPEEPPKPKTVAKPQDPVADAANQNRVLSTLPGAISMRIKSERESRNRLDNKELIEACSLLDLTPIPVPPLAKDPKQSEIAADKELRELNVRLSRIRDMVQQWKTMVKTGDVYRQDYTSIGEFTNYGGEYPSFDRLYAKYKLHLDLPPEKK